MGIFGLANSWFTQSVCTAIPPLGIANAIAHTPPSVTQTVTNAVSIPTSGSAPSTTDNNPIGDLLSGTVNSINTATSGIAEIPDKTFDLANKVTDDVSSILNSPLMYLGIGVVVLVLLNRN